MRYSGSKTYVARNDLKTAVNAAIIEAPLGLHDDAVRRLGMSRTMLK